MVNRITACGAKTLRINNDTATGAVQIEIKSESGMQWVQLTNSQVFDLSLLLLHCVEYVR